MSFERPITIKEAISNIKSRKYFLPAIQREFVWSTWQIEKLFDSLMRDYPIGSFLLWFVEKEKRNNFQFYEFVRNYSEFDSKHNVKANLSGENDIYGVLDGQQRLTALFIGLNGSYAYKLPRKRRNDRASYPKRKFFLNLYKESENIELKYDFEFLTPEEAKVKNESEYWFEVGKILEFKEEFEINDYLVENGIMNDPDKEKAKFANKTLFKLYSVINKNPIINYYLEKDEKLDKVLNIFIRVNSGGTELSYSDLLLSIATAQWKEKDAREEIIGFVEDINNIGSGFYFNKDFILKTCLVVTDIKDISFKVDNFNKSNMEKIEGKWDEITEAISLTVQLLSDFGYDYETLTSNNAIIPIIYYIYKINSPQNIITSGKYSTDRKFIKKYLIYALLKRTFSGQPDNVLRPLREVIKKNINEFPFDLVVKRLKGTNKSMSFDKDEIENLLSLKYGQSLTFSVLSLLYPNFDFRNKFHLDHIHPKSLFTKRRLLKNGVKEEDIETFKDYVNYIGNIQLLEGHINRQKLNTLFSKWVNNNFKTDSEKKDYFKKNFIPNVSLELSNFINFFEEREKKSHQKYFHIY